MLDSTFTTTRSPEWRVLGHFEVAVDGCSVELGGPQLRVVLARLVAAAGRIVSVDALATELWGDAPPEDAQRTVRTYVSRLRATMRRSTGTDDHFATRPPGYQLWIRPESVDAMRFERLAAKGRQALHTHQPRLAFRLLSTALGLWRGDAYGALAERGSLAAESARLDGLRMAAIESRIDAALATGLDAQMVVELESLVRAHPTHERLWGQLMTALYRSGRQAEALAAFRAVRTMLIRDHGIEPSPPLMEIHGRILRHDLGAGIQSDPAAMWCVPRRRIPAVRRRARTPVPGHG